MPTSKRDIIVIGGSYGAFDTLVRLVQRLPRDLPASLFVTLHVPSDARSYLAAILTEAGSLPAHVPNGAEKIEPGMIYVAPPDCHMLIDDGMVKLSHGPRENRHRPAIDPMFRSAARAYGARVIGVVLSGTLDDGSSGLMAIKMRGGLAVVQDPRDAIAAEMPQRAIRYVDPHYVVPAADIGPLLAKLSRQPVSTPESAMPSDRGDAPFESEVDDHKPGKPSAFACPECHGVLWEVKEGELLRFRCRVGHAYTAAALNEELSESSEAALWAALRVLEEKAALLKRMAGSNGEGTAARYKDQAQGYEKHAETVRNMLKEHLEPDARESRRRST